MARMDRRPRQRLDPAERREAILAAAAGLFGARAYDEVSIAEVAQVSGASEALVFRYFATKADLYAALVTAAVERLVADQDAALATLPPGVPARDRVSAVAHAYLDTVARHPARWAEPLRGGREPEAAREVRRTAHEQAVRALADLLEPRDSVRHDFAIRGYLGFLDAACLRWVDRGCPQHQRHTLVAAALGALEGALGDWDA